MCDAPEEVENALAWFGAHLHEQRAGALGFFYPSLRGHLPLGILVQFIANQTEFSVLMAAVFEEIHPHVDSFEGLFAYFMS